jgi:2-isopropylmalate synthase
VVTIFGKSWDLHVTHALGTTLDENVAMIGDSVAYLLKHFEEVIYDAEHFFDGFKKNREYALTTLKAAEAAGAHCLVLCDTNGGGLPHEVAEIIREVKKHVKGETPLGIHVHNDTECAVANTLAAVSEGVNHIQGTINGYGERCGNANLVSIIPNGVPKMGLDCIPRDGSAELRRRLALRLSWPIASREARSVRGDSAFALGAAVIHVSAVLQARRDLRAHRSRGGGHHRRVLVPELAGQSNIPWKAKEYGIDSRQEHPGIPRILEMLKRMEDEGFQFEGAEASFELLMERALGNHRPYFELDGFRVIVEEERGGVEPVAEATVRLKVRGIAEHTAASGHGPVNALDHALRKALEDFYPNLREMSLLDYKVRILDESKGTAAKTRVLITSGDGNETWGTVGVATYHQALLAGPSWTHRVQAPP